MEQKKKKRKFRINKTWILILVLILLTGILLAVSFYIEEPQQLTEELVEEIIPESDGEPEETASTILEFSDSPRISTVSGRYEMDINIATNGDKLTLAQLELSYDPRIIRIEDILPGDFIANPEEIQKNIDDSTGRIKYWLGTQGAFADGNGTIATIRFIKIGSGSASIDFEPKTSINAIDIPNSALSEFYSGFIDELPTPSPTPPPITDSPNELIN